jgi:hypothetical protein
MRSRDLLPPVSRALICLCDVKLMKDDVLTRGQHEDLVRLLRTKVRPKNEVHRYVSVQRSPGSTVVRTSIFPLGCCDHSSFPLCFSS